MFCTKCGYELNVNAKFCPKCGTPAMKQPASQPQEAPVEKPVEASTEASTEAPVETTESVVEAPVQESANEEIFVAEDVTVQETAEDVSTEEAAVQETVEDTSVEETPAVDNTEEKVLTVDEVIAEKSAEVKEPAAEATVEQPAPQPTPQPAPQWSPIPPAVEPEAPKKKGKKGLIIAIIVVVILALLAVAGYFGYKFINNPAKMLTKAIDNQTDSLVEDYEVSYNSLQESYANVNGDMTLSVDVSMGDQVKKLLAESMDLTEADISWLNSFGATVAMDVQDDSLGLDVDASINGTHITTFQTIIDAKKDTAYIAVPEIVSDAAFTADMDMDGQEVIDALAEYTTQLATYTEQYPTPAELGTAADKYANIIKTDLAGADIKKGKKDLKASGVSGSYTELAITIDSKTGAQITYDLAEAFEEDDDLKEMLTPFIQAEIDSEEDSEYDTVDEYWDEIESDVKSAKKDAEKTLEKIEKNPKKNKDIGVLYVYLTNSFEIKGLVYDDEEEGEVLKFYMPQDGDDTGLQLTVKSPKGETLTVEGKGTSKDDFLNGTYTVSMDDEEYFTVQVKDFDEATYRKNRDIKGEFLVTLGEGMSDSIYEDDMQFLALAQYDFVVNTEGLDGTVDMNIMADNNSLLEVNMSYSMQDVPDMSVPSTVYNLDDMDGEALMNLLKIVDLSSTVSNLEAAKVPEEYVEILKAISETLKSGDEDTIYAMILGLFGGYSYYDDYYYDEYYYDDYYYDYYDDYDYYYDDEDYEYYDIY